MLLTSKEWRACHFEGASGLPKNSHTWNLSGPHKTPVVRGGIISPILQMKKLEATWAK